MIWTINLMYLILWTSLSGAIVSVIWFAIGRLLEKAGFLHITYTLLKVAILFWFVPITYGMLLLRTQMDSIYRLVLIFLLHPEFYGLQLFFV